jgi:carboxymethylenebutenolidase
MGSNEIEELVHLYVDGAFNRRELFRRVAGLTGSTATATVALTALGVPDEAAAQTADACPENVRVSADDTSVESVFAEFPGEAGKTYGYLSLPRKEYTGPMPAIVVVHENRGLTEHIKDVNRRLAKAGYVSIAVDLLSRQGGTDSFPDPVDAAAAYRNVTNAIALADTRSALEYVRTLGVVRSDRTGALGFCAGGGHVWNLAVRQPDLGAGVVYYGAPAPADQINSISAPMLLHYGQLDRTFVSMIPPALAALNDRRKTYELHIHEGAAHAFNNDTGANFAAAASCNAWRTTLDFLARHLWRE